MTKTSTTFAQYCKSTLNLPKTSFPMHRTKGMSVYEELLKPKIRFSEHPEKILLDGPPFANGQLHIGHALNKILKDMIVRSSKQPMYWTPGWDCHGLPIELKARINHYQQQQQDNPLLLRRTCEKYASEAIRKQKSTMQSWALNCDNSGHYKTMDPSYEANGLRILARMIRKGLVYSALRPVYWSPSSRTALAEAEVEYSEIHCTTAFVRFPVAENTFMLAWTTTPWTLFGNRALSINPLIEYVKVTHEASQYILSKRSAMELFPNARLDAITNLPNRYFFEGDRPILMADWVNAEVGTGIVHLAPAHGFDDYLLCKQNGIEIDDTLIDEDAKFTSGPLQGKCIFEKDTESSILEQMKEYIFRTREITHSYPIDWRTKQPLVFRATRQWFLKTNLLNDFVEKALENVTFVPPSAKETLIKTIKGRKSDWCISRQRIWGLPIPAFLHKVTKEQHLDPIIVERFAEIVAMKGTDVWYNLEPKDFGLSNDIYERGGDTLDVWFESGTAWSTLPANLSEVVIVEGSDQFRGWFQSLLLTWLASQDHLQPNPVYTTLIKHGFVLDAQGKKMSKSVGNVVDPQYVCENYGVDTLRLWVACSAYTTDVTIGPETLSKCAEKLQKFRNTLRFILGNQIEGDDSTMHELRPLDEAALNTLTAVCGKVESLYAEYKFDEAVKVLYEFVTEDLSGFYFDLIKDRLYVTAAESLERRSAQIALSIIGDKLCHFALSPIVPFLCTEYAQHRSANIQAINLTSDLNLNELKRLRAELVNGNEDTTRLRMFIPREKVGTMNETDLRELLKCSSVRISDSEFKKEIVSEQKCVRCWSFRVPLGDEICSECSAAVRTQNKKKIAI